MSDESRIATIPNLLTAARLASLPATIILARSGQPTAAACVFVAAMVTDCFDGWLAKRLDQRSALGVYLDPVVDKIVILALLYELSFSRLIPAAIPHLFLARELLQSAVRDLAAVRGDVVGANWMGKTKAALQTVLVAWGLLMPAIDPAGWTAREPLRATAWAVLALSYIFFAVFLFWNRNLFRGRGRP